MMLYFDDVIVPISNGRPCALVIYIVYILQMVKYIELIVVPSCMSSIFVSRNVGVNGGLKACEARTSVW